MNKLRMWLITKLGGWTTDTLYDFMQDHLMRQIGIDKSNPYCIYDTDYGPLEVKVRFIGKVTLEIMKKYLKG